MSIGAFWATRAKAKHAAVDASIAIKRARGPMKHWSLFQMREAAEGGRMPQSHVMRPSLDSATSSVNGGTTMCGWHEVSFKAAGRFGFPSAKLWPCGVTPLTALELEPKIGCPVCCDVLHDIATWIELSRLQAGSAQGVHLAWFPISSAITACARTNVITAMASDFRKITGNQCVTCKAIYERVWGVDKPESQYLSFMTNEEAAEILRKGK